MSHTYSRSSLILNSALMHNFVKLFKMSNEGRKEGGGGGGQTTLTKNMYVSEHNGE